MEHTPPAAALTSYPQMHQNQNTNPNPLQPHPHPPPISTSLYSSYYYPPPPPPAAADPQNQRITTQFYTTDPTTSLTPPGVDSYTTYPHLAYYFDPNSNTWVAKEAVRQYGSTPAAFPAPVSNTIPPNGTEQLAVSHLDSTMWANLTFLSQANSNQKQQQKKTQQKKMKVVQSAYCEVCRVDCNSKDVLDQHKLGKKHKKNLEKLQAATAAGCSVSAGSSNPVIGPLENPGKSENGNGQKSKKKAAEPLEDLNTKRRRILEGGAAAEAVRVCSFCNVVCNSETVFNSHLAGQKHAAMMKKLAAGIRMATAI
uniref:U1-type domain-containing protein n=1 Tax=Salix viminalis TaxID=40686 RepID=A0A6N2N0J5_SALVM